MANRVVIRKSNDLIMAKYKLTLEENRLVLYLISMIAWDDQDFKEYEVSIKAFCAFSGIPPNNVYDVFRKMCDSLLQKRLDLIENNRVVHLCWLGQAVFYPQKGTVTLAFAPALKPYLLDLKGNFTYYDLRNAVSLRSSFSIRMYELLKQFEKLGKRTFALEDLKAVLCVDKQYAQYGDFKKFVILISQRELAEKCDVRFDFEEVKVGRKVEKIRFTIHPNHPHPKNLKKQDNANIIDGECVEEISPAPARPASRIPPKELSGDGPPELLGRLSFIEEDLPVQALMAIYTDAGGDVDLIRRRYDVLCETGARDVTAWMRAAVRQPDENFQKAPRKASQPRKKNQFANFTQRSNDYDDLERMELERFKKAVESYAENDPAF